MAVARTGSVQAFTSSADSGSQNITVPTSSLFVLGVGGWASGNTAIFSGGTLSIGGNALTLAISGETHTALAYKSALFYRVNPPTGTQAVAWNWLGTGALGYGCVFTYAFYTGVNTTTPIGATFTNHVTDGTPPTTIATGTMTAANGDMMVGYGVTDDAHTLTWTSATEALQTQFNLNEQAFAEQAMTGNGSASLGSSSGFVTLAVAIIQQAAIASGMLKLMMHHHGG